MKHWKLFVGVFCVLFQGLISQANAAPPIPATFWGTATSPDGPLPEGTVIEARINNVTVATTVVFTHDGQEGLYLIDVPGDDPDTLDVIEGDKPIKISPLLSMVAM